MQPALAVDNWGGSTLAGLVWGGVGQPDRYSSNLSIIVDDRLYFLIEYHMGHSALEEERVKGRDCSGLVHDMGWNITLTGDHVVRWAIGELDAGRTSEALARLAAVQEPTTWRDVAELFRVAYADLGYDRLTKEQHLLLYAKEIAGRIVRGSIDPIEGCAGIWYIGEHLQFPAAFDLQTCDSLLAGYDPVTNATLDETSRRREIIRYASTISDHA